MRFNKLAYKASSFSDKYALKLSERHSLRIFFKNCFNLFCHPRLCIKTGIQEQGTECGIRGEWGQCYIPGNVTKHSGESPQKFQAMSLNILRNVDKHSGECPHTFWGMFSNIPGNVLKHSRECPQTFRGMLPHISGNVTKHSGEHSSNILHVLNGQIQLILADIQVILAIKLILA